MKALDEFGEARQKLMMLDDSKGVHRREYEEAKEKLMAVMAEVNAASNPPR